MPQRGWCRVYLYKNVRPPRDGRAEPYAPRSGARMRCCGKTRFSPAASIASCRTCRAGIRPSSKASPARAPASCARARPVGRKAAAVARNHSLLYLQHLTWLQCSEEFFRFLEIEFWISGFHTKEKPILRSAIEARRIENGMIRFGKFVQ